MGCATCGASFTVTAGGGPIHGGTADARARPSRRGGGRQVKATTPVAKLACLADRVHRSIMIHTHGETEVPGGECRMACGIIPGLDGTTEGEVHTAQCHDGGPRLVNVSPSQRIRAQSH